MASSVVALTGSATPTKPASLSPFVTYITVCPCACNAATSASAGEMSTPASCIKRALPINANWPWIVIDRAPGDLAAGTLLSRDGLASQHRLVDARLAFDDLAIDGNFGSGFHAEDVPSDHLLQPNLFIAAVGLHPDGRIGCEAQQVFDGTRRLEPGPQLEHLAQQHQGHDGRSSLEVQRQAVHGAKGLRQAPGEEQRVQTEDIRR